MTRCWKIGWKWKSSAVEHLCDFSFQTVSQY